MNKKEIAEVKKQFTQERCALTRICGCYVDGEKNKRTQLNGGFLSLPEDEIHKYFEILRKTLSGTIGKNLITMEFPLKAEEEGMQQEFLYRLKKSALLDEALLDEFYDRVIGAYNDPGNYLILIVHGAYDVPGKSKDGEEMFDASDEVYEYVLSCICPVTLSKAGLYYNSEDNIFETRIREWLVEMPQNGFLFPAFHDRSTDLHSVLYYSKKAEEIHEELIDGLLGCPLPMTAASQKENFQLLVEETLGEDCDYEAVKTIHETLNTWIEEKKEDPDPLELSKPEVKRLLEETGHMDEEKEEFFERTFESCASPAGTVLASNITNPKKFEVKTQAIKIHIDPEYLELVETKVIDGRTCLVIPVDSEVEVNGMHVQVR